MIKNITKRTLDTFAEIIGEEKMTHYLLLHNLLMRSLDSDEVNNLIIRHNYVIDYFDDFKVISINDKEICVLIEKHTDDEDEFGFIDSIFYYIVIDYIGDVLRVNTVEELESDEGYEFIKEDDFNNMLA